MRFLFASFLLILINHSGLYAQEILPLFSASLQTNGKVLISWRNTYPSINQISIQRSSDSLRNFTTVLTVPDPRLPENGFVDSKVTTQKVYYRMFILFGNSRYLFTKSRRAVADNPAMPVVKTETPLPAEKTPDATPAVVPESKKGKAVVRGKTVSKTKPGEKAKPEKPATVTPPPAVVAHPEPSPPVLDKDSLEDAALELQKIDNARIFYPPDTRVTRTPTVSGPGKIKIPTIRVDRTLFVKRRDSVIRRISADRVRFFSDSLIKQTKDTLLFVNADTLLIKPYNLPPQEIKEIYKASQYVFTAKDGNVSVALADFEKKTYSVKFFEADATPLLEIPEVTNAFLIVDKTNFLHSGWFYFELYEDGKLKEKNRFFIPKDF